MKSRNQQVDGLRGITVLMIVFYQFLYFYSYHRIILLAQEEINTLF